ADPPARRGARRRDALRVRDGVQALDRRRRRRRVHHLPVGPLRADRPALLRPVRVHELPGPAGRAEHRRLRRRGAGRPCPPGRAGRARRGRRRGGPDLQVVRPEGGAGLEPVRRPPTAELETRAWNALRAEDGERAASVLRQAGDGVNPFLRACIALLTGPVEMADDLFVAAYRAEPDGPPNLVPATPPASRGRAVALAARLR